jgi:uncharacterized protein YaaR (DUF327 family)
VVPVSDDNIEPLQPPPWVQFFKEAVPEILTPVVDAVSELKAEYQVDRDEWIARLDEIDQRLDELTRRIGKIEHQLAKGTEP